MRFREVGNFAYARRRRGTCSASVSRGDAVTPISVRMIRLARSPDSVDDPRRTTTIRSTEGVDV